MHGDLDLFVSSDWLKRELLAIKRDILDAERVAALDRIDKLLDVLQD